MESGDNLLTLRIRGNGCRGRNSRVTLRGDHRDTMMDMVPPGAGPEQSTRPASVFSFGAFFGLEGWTLGITPRAIPKRMVSTTRPLTQGQGKSRTWSEAHRKQALKTSPPRRSAGSTPPPSEELEQCHLPVRWQNGNPRVHALAIPPTSLKTGRPPAAGAEQEHPPPIRKPRHHRTGRPRRATTPPTRRPRRPQAQGLSNSMTLTLFTLGAYPAKLLEPRVHALAIPPNHASGKVAPQARGLGKVARKMVIWGSI